MNRPPAPVGDPYDLLAWRNRCLNREGVDFYGGLETSIDRWRCPGGHVSAKHELVRAGPTCTPFCPRCNTPTLLTFPEDTDSPVLHLTNHQSRNAPQRGPSGRVWTIMVRPGAWGWGSGRVDTLTPPAALLDGYRRWVELQEEGAHPPDGDQGLCLHDYRSGYLERLAQRFHLLAPGRLSARGRAGRVPVDDGDTLTCGCSRAVAGRWACHRVWAAWNLLCAGWRVVLDGVELAKTPGLAEGWCVGCRSDLRPDGPWSTWPHCSKEDPGALVWVCPSCEHTEPGVPNPDDIGDSS